MLIIIYLIYKLELLPSVNIMICGYENIYDLCTNKYTYQYSFFNNNGKYIIPATGSNDPVIRTDITSGQKFLLSSTDLLNIEDCGNNTDLSLISAWDCYQIYRQSNKTIDIPPLNDFKNAQKNYIINQYNQLLENGILIKINDYVVSSVVINSSGSGSGSGSETQDTTTSFSIRLPAKTSDQIYYSNILALVNLWYSINSNFAIPKIIDYYNRSQELSYVNLNKIFVIYFKKLKEYLEIKNDLLDIIDKAETIYDVQRAIFYTSRQISSPSTPATS